MTRRPRNALLAACVCLLGLVITGAIARLTTVGQLHDDASLNGFMRLNDPRLGRLANVLVTLGDPPVYVAIGLCLVIVALARGLPRLGLVIPVVMTASVFTSELLKPLSATPRVGAVIGWHIADASWPSGHATAAMTLALCAVLVAPRVARPIVAVAAMFAALGSGYGLLVLAWHLPSDVFGGYLMAGMWVSLVVAALWWADRRWPARTGRRAVARAAGHPRVGSAALLALLVVAVGVAAFAAHGNLTETYAAGRASFLGGAVALAGLAGLLVCVLGVALGSADRQR